MTPKQKALLDFITLHMESHGYMPTYTEIGEKFGFSSKGTVRNYLQSLEKQGLISRQAHVARGITLSESDNQIALLGKVAAGRPIEYTKHNEYLDVPAKMLKRGAQHFALQISGDSMIEEGILDSDYVIIRKQSTADNGQIVVAQVENETTLKRYYNKRSHIELHSANNKYKPLIIEHNQNFSILGIYSGLLRFKT